MFLIPENKKTDTTRKLIEVISGEIWSVERGDRKFSVQNDSESSEATVMIYDYIGWPFNDPAEFTREIMSLPVERLNVLLHSPGGNFYDAVAMMAALRTHPANVTVSIMGLAASAATVLMMGADRIRMVKGASIMIHNAWLVTIGDTALHAENAAFLSKIDKEIRGIYKTKTKQTDEQIRRWMNQTTYFNAEEALESRFVDETFDGTVESSVVNMDILRTAAGDHLVENDQAMNGTQDNDISENAESDESFFNRSRNLRRLALAETCGL